METSKQKYTYATATRTLLADLYTPVAVYMRLRDLYPKSALMESSDYHGHDNSRSFFGIHPLASVAVSHGQAVFTMPGGQVETRPVTDAYPVEQAMADFIAAFHVEGEGSQYCGLYGYTAFDAVRYFEHIDVAVDRQRRPRRVLHPLQRYHRL